MMVGENGFFCAGARVRLGLVSDDESLESDEVSLEALRETRALDLVT